jgi:hypothetical protein
MCVPVTVVAAGGARVGVAHRVLDFFQRYTGVTVAGGEGASDVFKRGAEREGRVAAAAA